DARLGRSVQADDKQALLQRYREEATALSVQLRELVDRPQPPVAPARRWFRAGARAVPAAESPEVLGRAAALLAEIGVAMEQAQGEVSLLLRERSHLATLLNISHQLTSATELTE